MLAWPSLRATLAIEAPQATAKMHGYDSNGDNQIRQKLKNSIEFVHDCVKQKGDV